MKTVIEMAREAGLHEARENPPYFGASALTLERFAAIVAARASAAEQKKWQDQAMVDIHEAVLDERKQCLHAAEVAASLLNDPIAAIRARGNK